MVTVLENSFPMATMAIMVQWLVTVLEKVVGYLVSTNPNFRVDLLQDRAVQAIRCLTKSCRTVQGASTGVVGFSLTSTVTEIRRLGGCQFWGFSRLFRWWCAPSTIARNPELTWKCVVPSGFRARTDTSIAVSPISVWVQDSEICSLENCQNHEKPEKRHFWRLISPEPEVISTSGCENASFQDEISAHTKFLCDIRCRLGCRWWRKFGLWIFDAL